jgi:hypothetical protein
MDSPVFTGNQIESLGRRLLNCQPNAIILHRILRDVLRLPPGCADIEITRLQMLTHPWVAELACEQRPDGTWGRFHSMDSTLKSRFPTSETAIRRALALGLEKDDPVLARAVGFMEQVLEGKAAWSDRVEKSKGWLIGVEAITAGTLAQVDSAHPSILPAWEYWVEIARRCFPKGAYDPQAEWKAHKELRGIGIIYLRSRYVLTLLGSRRADLPAGIDHRIIDWIWHNPEGVGYLGADMQHPQPFHIFNWLESLEILAHFQSWRDVAVGALNWLWNQRNADGLWDFGAKVSKSFHFPLSDDWRKTGNRAVDHSTRILVLLQHSCNVS